MKATTIVFVDLLQNKVSLRVNTSTGLSSQFIAQLHHLVEKIVKLKDELQAKEVHHVSGTIYGGKGRPITFHELETGAVHVNLSTLHSRDNVVQKASYLNLPTDGSVAVLKE